MKNKKEEQTELVEFIEQVRSDDALQKRIGEAGTMEQTADGLAELAREEGHTFTRDEILAELKREIDESAHPDNGSSNEPDTTMGNP